MDANIVEFQNIATIAAGQALCLVPAIALLGLITELQRGKFKSWLLRLGHVAI